MTSQSPTTSRRKEFAAQLTKAHHERPDAILLTNIIDNFQKGSFLPSYIRTLQGGLQAMKNAHLLSVSPRLPEARASAPSSSSPQTGISAAKDFDAYVNNAFGGQAASAVVPESLVDEFLTKRRSIVITDDHAPVD
ncbi:MAG: hypothetical protein MZV70_28170 [Desulfobacterales bacterium]|nr:hypothetical protein [Desulfobacterales bacterium]